ncbi:hypothetical protein HYV74_03680 [Candidatus Uhrbacteria bacterium]|nr:hypothetical protein [Candidatus Uhrbacteria bacterium]
MRRHREMIRLRRWGALFLGVLSMAYVLMPFHVTSAAMTMEHGSMAVGMVDRSMHAPIPDADANTSVCSASHQAVSIREQQEQEMAVLPVIRCVRIVDASMDRRGVRLDVSRYGGDPPSRALTGTVIKQE